jgi:hypothetical protein
MIILVKIQKWEATTHLDDRHVGMVLVKGTGNTPEEAEMELQRRMERHRQDEMRWRGIVNGRI